MVPWSTSFRGELARCQCEMNLALIQSWLSPIQFDQLFHLPRKIFFAFQEVRFCPGVLSADVTTQTVR